MLMVALLLQKIDVELRFCLGLCVAGVVLRFVALFLMLCCYQPLLLHSLVAPRVNKRGTNAYDVHCCPRIHKQQGRKQQAPSNRGLQRTQTAIFRKLAGMPALPGRLLFY